MDITEEYIKMRIAAIPFLGKGNIPRLPVTLYCFYDNISVLVGYPDHYFIGDNSKTDTYICVLEHQDQLQAMVEEKALKHQFGKILWLTTRISDFVHYNYEYIKIFNSMEQIWLAFVMHELHKTKLDGEKWIKR